MTRDYDKFPDDENGDVLWRMHQSGDNLSIAREITFSAIFPNEDAALDFAVHILRNGLKVSFSANDGNEKMPWQVHAHAGMEPIHENISRYEQLLGNDAAEFGGRNDGWGCMQQG